MDVKEFGVDFLSADAHKWLMGPEGVGIFYCTQELVERLSPMLIGWKSVKNEFDFDHADFCPKSNALRFEEGSMNLLGIFGLGAAVDLLLEIGIQRIEERVLDLGDFIIGKAEERGYSIRTPKAREERGGNITIAGSFDPAKVNDLLLQKGIMVNCRGGGIRVSPHFYNNETDLQTLFRTMDEVAGGSGARPQ